MKERVLGRPGVAVSALGLGCMGASKAYGPADRDESVATIRRAIDLGVVFFDTADGYGSGHNERLLGVAVAHRRDEVVLATKCGMTSGPGGERRVNGRPDHVTVSCDASLARLGVDRVDLFYLHRVDPAVPIEESVGAMADLVHAGKIGHLGLCEASVDSLTRAAAVHPIAALQCEWSLWCRDIETEVLATARQLGIGVVPYSPLGRGFLTGGMSSIDDLSARDYRRSLPRFEPTNLAYNVTVLAALRRLAEQRGASPGQLALAWLLAQGDDVVPIPGTTRRHHLEENVAATAIDLSPGELDTLDRLFPVEAWAGERFSPEEMPLYGGYGSTPASHSARHRLRREHPTT